MAATVNCPNYELNEQMCPCTEKSCPQHGICCDCMRYHRNSEQWPKTACMRGTKRPESTMSLPIAIPTACPNREINVESCPCTNTECSQHAFCCSCVRAHWKPDGSSRTKCMRD